MDFRLVDDSDPGDETQRNFRYQNAYGVILLVASRRGSKSYTAIWCEYHEDILAECNDGTLDAYQIKTRRPEDGLWDLRDEPLWKSIKGFVSLFRVFHERICNYYFVSNINFPKPTQYRDNVKPAKFANNPAALIHHIQSIPSITELDQIFNEPFRRLISFCQCTDEELFTVLSRTYFTPGPSRQDFDAVIAHEHLAKLPECLKLYTKDLNIIRDELVMKVYQASSLFIDDPDRHITPLYSQIHVRPEINVKRVSIQVLHEVIESVKQRSAEGLTSNDGWDRVLYVCHASPEDDEFAKWVAFQLINAGYSAWCDLISIKPGASYDEIAKEVIEKRSGKFLFIVSQKSSTDPRLLEQLQLAYDRMRANGFDRFIIPLELGANHSDVLLLKKFAPIDFSVSWAQGMKALIDLLSSENYTRKQEAGPSASNSILRSLYGAEQGVFVASDEYISNWFKIQKFPDVIQFHKLRRVGGIGSIQVPSNLPYPGLTHSDYLVSFADASDFTGQLGNVEIINTTDIAVGDFLQGNFDQHLVHAKHAKKLIIQLINKAWEKYIANTSLTPYQMSNGKTCYYYHHGCGEAMVSFLGVNQKKTRRSLWGYKTVLGIGGIKMKKFWHYGISGKAISFPEFVLLLKSHVLFSDDGIHIWDSKSKLHAARRSWCNNWWNPHWRDRLLAMVTFIANDQPQFEMAVGKESFIVVQAQPISFLSPISYLGPKEERPEEEDEDTEVLALDLLEDFPFDSDKEENDD